MNALRLAPEGLGYGPARVARLESEQALRRALPISVAIVGTLLASLALVQRLVPAAPVEIPVILHGPHDMIGRIHADMPAPPAALPVAHPVASAGHVPVPVPDAVAPPVATPSAGGATSGPLGVPGGGASAGDGSIGAVPVDPEPGVWQYTDEQPRAVFTPVPEYPDMAREAQVEGTVTLWALVDLDGHVKAVRVIQGELLLREAAKSALLRWRFTPALANKHPVLVWVAVPVRFSLR